MNSRFPVVGLMGKHQDGRVRTSLYTLASHLLARGCEALVPDNVSEPDWPDGVRRLDEAELVRQARLLITVGGDGSLLYAARRVAGTGIPLLGINRGRLGFLADVSPDQMLATLDGVLAGHFVREHRMLLCAELLSATGGRETSLALNDVVVKRNDTGRMFDCETFIDGRYVNTHGGDGLVVASPTGSTAYALSCGGPIIEPNLEAIVLTPICPHTLSDRPIVIGADRVTEVRLPAGYPDAAEVSCDGQPLGLLTSGDCLRITASPQRVELIHPPGYDYFDILRSKLRWGSGPRQRHQVPDS